MPQKAWSAKRERQYVHIKDSLLELGTARVANEERAQHGEAVEASASSITDISAGRRGGTRTRDRSAKRCSSFATRRDSAA